MDARPYWHRTDDNTLKPILFDRLLVYYDIAENVCTVLQIELLTDQQIQDLTQQEAESFKKQSITTDETSSATEL